MEHMPVPAAPGQQSVAPVPSLHGLTPDELISIRGLDRRILIPLVAAGLHADRLGPERGAAKPVVRIRMAARGAAVHQPIVSVVDSGNTGAHGPGTLLETRRKPPARRHDRRRGVV